MLMIVVTSTAVVAQTLPMAPAASPTTQLPPATKIEGFKPAAGSVVTLGYDELGEIRGVSVDVRELRDASNRTAAVRGLLVEITESQYRKERSFVDAYEIPELLRGMDALLEVKSNPTSFSHFEVRYTTKGELRLTTFNSGNDVSYAIEAGRGLKAQRFINADDMRRLKDMFTVAQTKLAAATK